MAQRVLKLGSLIFGHGKIFLKGSIEPLLQGATQAWKISLDSFLLSTCLFLTSTDPVNM